MPAARPTEPSLTVPLDRRFSSSGNGLVSQRSAEHVLFNGFEFLISNGYPELKGNSTELVQRAWPAGLLRPDNMEESGDPVYGVESVKCAPETWVLRRPLRHFGNDRFGRPELEGRGTRDTGNWTPTKTYKEPSFPVLEGKAASHAMRNICSAVQRCFENCEHVGPALRRL